MGDIELENAIELYSTMVLRLAMSYVHNIQDAQDISQEVFIKLYHQDSFHSELHLKRWLIRVTLNQCKDSFRLFHKKRVVFKEDLSWIQAVEENKIHGLLDQLKKKERLFVYLHYIEGYSLKEIGELLDCNPNTVSTTIRRALKKLRMEVTI